MGCLYSKGCIGQVPISPRDSKIKEIENARAVGDSSLSPVSSSEQGGEYGDELHQLSLTRDSDLAINRLSRVSSQFLPPDGSRAIRVPAVNYELRYSYLSQRGYYPDALDKANQDSFCIHSPFGTNPNDHFFGVFDGHGEFGAQCSQFAKRKLCENLLRNSRFHMDAVEACHAAFLATNSQLHSDSLDDSMSGTTAITILVRGRTIYIANSGDSRAVIAERRGKDIVAVDLSIDQTPFRADELERVKNCGARVLTLDQIEGLKNPDVQCWGTEEGDDGDPPRLWIPNGMYPGTAFTRSIGDSIAESIGVVATPEIVVLELTPNHPFFVIASDGVFEFLSSQTVVDMVSKFKDPRDACAAIVAESYRLWLQYETRTDDITIIVVHINGLTDTDVVQTSKDVGIRPLHQVIEVPGSESPSTISWNSRNLRARHDLSRARLRAIESSLENGHVWVPPSPSHRKTWEEEAHIERALHDHFLFRKLTDSQCHVLLDCMQRVEVQPGDVVVQQGGEGDCFYVVGSGEFEVLATQEEKDEAKEVNRVLHRYTAEKMSSFGELALMYNKPLQSSVRAVTGGTLWALKREDFRGILMSEFSNLSSLKLLRSVELLSRLTILQLSHIADSLLELSFSDGQTIIDKNESLSALYIIQKGRVRLTYNMDLIRSPNICSILPENLEQEDPTQDNNECSVEKAEGSYFGEWTLLGEHVDSLSAVAVGDVVCVVITKERFDSAVGPLAKLPQDDRKLKDCSLSPSKEHVTNVDATNFVKVKFSDLEWRTGIYSTDCSEIGLVLLKGSEIMLSLKRFSKQRIKQLGKEAQVLKEKDLMKSVSPSSCVPPLLCTCADEKYVGILLSTCLACPLSSILHAPLDEESARFCAASVVVALEELHKNNVLYRGVSPDVLMCDRAGHLQLVDFRFGKKLSSERTFTICGMADSLAPEIVQGKGHGLAADWWALGVLIYFMLQAEMPFGSWRESELDTFAKIAKGQLTLPQSFSPEVVDLIMKLLEVDETVRLGSKGPDSVKNHQWFEGIDWKGIIDNCFPIPHEITSRINLHLENHAEDMSFHPSSPFRDVAELNTPEWLEDW
ncbi:protein phosphatase 2C and cyclic nucleotide-binding/kinase domain-containing protein isoform X1 [Magnolia sinica]|uniref:protein phosphatase 2C and cyclic nucleotide-binding/kinase domain-containing protein isoform X1 n=1 Tax=Magnolia sinica TaxID=86752 RepID=UPI00265A6187|nr:protein phosphatase 2C and cyclic nucleotide-binding/kinase domain-containing protein isoform X1 [Magnolia sinica]